MTKDNTEITTGDNKPAKPEIIVDTRILNPDSEFREKLLCDGRTLSPGSSCFFTCAYCYTESMMNRGGSEVSVALKAAGKTFSEVVIRRKHALGRLRHELDSQSIEAKQKPLVVYISPADDVAATPTYAEEAAELCKLVLSSTAWHIRILSKSPLISSIAAAIPAQWKGRIILGLSTGTLDDDVAKAIEPDAPPPSERLQTLRELQRQGYRTFGMLCPILPQDPVAYVGRARSLINFKKCEHVWAEVVNRRGHSMARTAQALEAANLTGWHQRLRQVFGKGSTPAWEAYARSTFAALTAVVPGEKLRFLQYVTEESITHWMAQKACGAIPLGEAKDEWERTHASHPEDEPKTKHGEPVNGHVGKATAAPAQAEAQEMDSKAKHSAAGKKAWVTIRRKRAEAAAALSQVKPQNAPSKAAGNP